jgi:hypothetical protein
VDFGFAIEEPGARSGKLCSSLSAAHNFSSVRVHRQAKGQARFTGAKNGPTPSQAFIPPSTSMASHFSSKQIGFRSRPCPVLSHEARGGEIGIVNKAVHVCLGLGNVLPVAISLRPIRLYPLRRPHTPVRVRGSLRPIDSVSSSLCLPQFVHLFLP